MLMFEGVKAGWTLARAVRSMVSRNRSLLAYPVLSAVTGIVLFGITLLGAFFMPVNIELQWREIIGFVAGYLLTAFVSTYFLVAMLIEFRSGVSGAHIDMSEALARTRPYAGKIFMWAVFYTALVMILRALESRSRGLASVVIGVAGSIAITVATFFAVPAILEKKLGPVGAVRESVATITRTIGPTFGGVAYIDLYTLLFAAAGFTAIVASVLILPISLLLMIVLLFVGMALIVFGLVQNYTFFNILKLIIYDYYNGLKLPEGISEAMLGSAIKRRGQGRPAYRRGVMPH